MKKFLKLTFLVLVATTSILITSCSKDDDDLSKDEIVGTWKASEVSTNGTSYSAWPFETTTATFNSNGTYSGRGYFGNGTGTWTKKGNTVYTYIDGEEYYKYEVLEISSNTCTLKMGMTGSDSYIWLKCIKQ